MHVFIKPPSLSYCPKCKKPARPHTVCLNCGYYKGEEIIDVLKKLTKKERKKHEKEMEAKKEKGEKTKEKSLTWEEMSHK